MEPLTILLYIYSFVIGCCVASFINVVIYRVPKEISIAKGRSFCPTCNTHLVWYELIPIVSWIGLKGKCRTCRQPISMRYLLMELIGGIIGVFCFYHYQWHWMSIVSFVLAMVLLAITVIDFDTMTIPNGLVLWVGLLAICTWIVYPEIDFVNRCIGMLSISGFLLLLTLCIPGAFGGGDIKLMFVAGFMLGWANTLLAFFIAVLIAGGYAIYLLLSKKKGRKQHIAFGPYLCLGIFVSLLYGTKIIEWYVSLCKF